MAKLYFKYGAMGSSKTATALITKFNYEEQGMIVGLLKPSIENRDGATVVRSRIGLSAEATLISPDTDIFSLINNSPKVDVIIIDECQFLSRENVLQLRNIVSYLGIPVLCFGLRTNFRAELFEGSKALFELADSIQEIKSICSCGNKAIINARLDNDGHVTIKGEEFLLGGNNQYVGMCWHCYQEALKK